LKVFLSRAIDLLALWTGWDLLARTNAFDLGVNNGHLSEEQVRVLRTAVASDEEFNVLPYQETYLVMTSAGVVVGAIIGGVFFTRTEVTIATKCDSLAILDVSELRILHVCRRVDGSISCCFIKR